MLSIIVPVYNTEKYLAKCLDSIIQALEKVEIKTEVLVINDGSTDNSKIVIEKYKNEHPQLIAAYDKPNGGLSDVKNFGLDHAKGEFISFIDSDDFVDPEMFYDMMNGIMNSSADAAVCDIKLVYDDKTERVWPCTNSAKTDAFEAVIDMPMMASSCNKIIRKSLFDGIYFPKGINNEDIAVTPIVLGRTSKIVIINKPYYNYYQRSGSIQNGEFNERRFAILQALQSRKLTPIAELTAKINEVGLSIDIETVKFELTSLSQAGFQISHDHDIYCMQDNLILDERKEEIEKIDVSSYDSLEKSIEHYVVEYADSIPSRLVDSLIRYGSNGRDNCAEFEGAVTRFFTFMGYESTQLGQGNGRVADVIARYKDSMMAKSYGLIIDAKAYSRYNFNAPDVRKMKEYIALHQKELMMEMIPRHAYAFVSMDFVPEENALNEISNDTAVNGTAIDVFSLLELGAKTSKQEVKISDIYDSFTTNKRFVCPA